MKKAFKNFAIMWLFMLILFNCVAFIIPADVFGGEKYTSSFWVGYLYITLAFFAELGCGYMAFKAENLTKMFYNIPLITISYSGLVVLTILGIIIMFVPGFPYWAGILICLAVLAINGVSLAKADLNAEAVENIDKKVSVQTQFVKLTTATAENILARATSDETKVECKKVYEAIRYSDPMSFSELAMDENQISMKIGEFASAVGEDNIEKVKSIANELVILINDRNNKCKALK